MNKITKIFDNVGFLCSVQNNLFIPKSNIQGYTNLDNTSIGYYIPYLVRNVKDGYKWETGVGEIQYLDSAIVVKRHEVSSSSNDNKAEKFTGNNNEFYLFVNNTNFNTAFNNVILKNDHFTIDNINSIYLVDTSSSNIDAILPEPNNARNIVIDIKPLNTNHIVVLRENNGKILYQISDSIRMVCDGQSWYALNETDSINPKSLSISDDVNFNIQSVPGGNTYSFQFNDGANNFAGSELYWGSGDSNKLLLGSSSESLAHTVIPTSGSFNTVFNQDYQASDFIVYGSGDPYRNLFFAYDGRLGINIPSGSRPQTIFHVVNYSCSEILRLENRTACRPAKFTLYHKPSGSLSNGDVCSIINLAGKNSDNTITEYANITSLAINPTNRDGGIVLSVASGGYQQSLISGDINNIKIGYADTRQINLNNNGDLSISGTNINILSSSTSTVGTTNNNISFNENTSTIQLKFDELTLGSGTVRSLGNLTVTDLSPANLYLSSLADGSFLTIQEDKVVAASGIAVSGNTINIGNVGANKILSTGPDGYINGTFGVDDYFLTEGDIVWSKFNPRSGSVCLKQIIFDENVPSTEFAIGDQIEIVTDTATIYRTVTDVVLSNEVITELLLDQNVTTNTVNNITALSITKGGFLTIQKSVVGSVSDSSSNIISIRPRVDTEFNIGRKDINLSIYGTASNPAFRVLSNIGALSRSSGIYYSYATRSNSISAILINTSGFGLSNSFSTANYNYNNTDNLFSGIVSEVGSNGRESYYKTYDQNGNVSEWIEPDGEEYEAGTQGAAGGSVETPSDEYLKSIEYASAVQGYDHIGFRVASIYGLDDNSTISSTLAYSFVTVQDKENMPDDGIFYEKRGSSYDQADYPNLGVVNYNYRIGKYEVTNNQYTFFLNKVATDLSPYTSGLYSDSMNSEDDGGIIAQDDGAGRRSYTVKSNMGNKPVTFVSYVNALKYINWLHNGAPTTFDEKSIIDVINDGAYTILSLGNNSYRIIKNENRKYYLPNLNEWHKAAYYENVETIAVTGQPAIIINTDTPHLVATEDVTANPTQQPRQLYATTTISGWLVVDRLIVRDNSFSSSLDDLGWDPAEITAQGFDSQKFITGGNTDKRPDTVIEYDRFYKHPSVSRSGKASFVSTEWSPPLVGIGFGTESLADCNSNNVPYWCQGDVDASGINAGKLRGPYFY